ncbi:MAG TPA: MAPEG family protein [Candidatus Limnocylindria bacterium]|jgi:glutathione S-transferase|nr:MAPEG family protein [Candidatus Limnocylindria bacterium]
MPDLLADPNVRLLALVDLLLVLKMIALGSYTSVLRLRRRVFATPEDYALQGATPPAAPDEDIERARRAHRNDLENILPFFVVSFLYVLTKPSYGAAALYFWGFLAARVLHSIFYVRGAQPHRTIAFTVGAVLMFVMLLRTLVAVV